MPRIVVVEDNAPERNLVRVLLSEEDDYEVEIVADGKEALEAIKRFPPDLVLTDLRMPGLDGLELVDQIRSHHGNIPVVVMTAYGNEEIACAALRHGAASYVPKRCLSDDLVRTIEEILEMSREQLERQRLATFIDGIEVRLSLENDLELISALIHAVQEHVETMDLWDHTARLQVGMALHEAVANAILHGNLEVPADLRETDLAKYYEVATQRHLESPYCERRVEVKVNLNRSGGIFRVRDAGNGFDPSLLPDPDDVSQLERVRGRGLLLIRTFMDEVRFNEAGNEITLFKAADKPAEDTPAEAASAP